MKTASTVMDRTANQVVLVTLTARVPGPCVVGMVSTGAGVRRTLTVPPHCPCVRTLGVGGSVSTVAGTIPSAEAARMRTALRNILCVGEEEELICVAAPRTQTARKDSSVTPTTTSASRTWDVTALTRTVLAGMPSVQTLHPTMRHASTARAKIVRTDARAQPTALTCILSVGMEGLSMFVAAHMTMTANLATFVT